MSQDPPTDLQERVARASEAQRAAIERFLAGGPLPEPRQTAGAAPGQTMAQGERDGAMAEVLASLARIERKVDAVRKRQRSSGAIERDEDFTDEELRKVYARVLLTSAKRSGGREAPLKEVFDRYCLDGLSAKKVSEVLGCSKSTVMLRLATLKEIARMPAARLRTYKPFFERAEESLRDARARRGPWKQAAYGEEARDAE